MKNKTITFLVLIVLAVFSLNACTSRKQNGTDSGSSPSQSASATPSPTATPTPTPSPVPFDYVVSNSQAGIDHDALIPCDGYDDIFAALALAEENAASDPWAGLDPAADPSVISVPEISGVRLGESAGTGDIMTTDGTLLYLLDEKDLLIVRLDGEETKLLSRTKAGEDWKAWDATTVGDVNGSEKIPASVFVLGHRLAILSDYYNYSTVNGEVSYTEYAAVDIYDITDPTAPVLMSCLGQDGAVRAAGVSGNAFYLVTSFVPAEDAAASDPSTYVPGIYSAGQKTLVSPDKFFVAADGSESSCALIGIYELTSADCESICGICGVSPDPFVGVGEMYFFTNRVASGHSRSYESEYGAAEETAALVCTDLIRCRFGTEYLTLDTPATVAGSISGPDCARMRDGELFFAVSTDVRRLTNYASGHGDVQRKYGFALLRLDEGFNVTDSVSLFSDGDEDGWIGYLDDTAVFTGVSSGTSYLLDLSEGNGLSFRTLDASVMADSIRSLGNNGYTAFYRTGSGKLTLTVYDRAMAVLDERVFGSDHSNTLENLHGYFADGDASVIAFSADDSYCVYGLDENGKLVLRGDVFLSDWAWNARGFLRDGLLYVADTKEIFVFDTEDFSRLLKTAF